MRKIGCTEDGVRRKEKKVRGTFFPPNRPTRHDHAEETLDRLMKKTGKRGRWGEEERKKGSGNLFSAEPTDEA